MRQEIVGSSTAIAYGDGLAKAIEGQEAMFYVDSRGQRGDLVVQVDGLLKLTDLLHSLFLIVLRSTL